MTTGDTPVITVDDITRTFPTVPPTVVLDGVSMGVAAGERVVVFGRSGAGKSTLLNILGLLDRPTAGGYRLLGRDVSTLRGAARDRLRADALGFVFQAHHVIGHRTVAENLDLKLSIVGMPRAERAAQVESVLVDLGLGERMHAAGATLSGGEKQRLAIARAVLTGPAVLLADEPTGNLDDGNTADVLSLFDAQAARGAAVVVITHDRRAAEWADRALSLVGGRVVEGVA
ncbi:MAG: ABC transporter ATP-binding protein [Dermatophilaceae bacterium]